MSEINEPKSEKISVKQHPRSRFFINFTITVVIIFGLYACVNDYLKAQKTNIQNRVSEYPLNQSVGAANDALIFINQVNSAMSQCDYSEFDLSSGLYGNDRVTQYQSAQIVKSRCDLNDAIDKIGIPKSLGRKNAELIGISAVSCALAANFRVMSALKLEDGLKDEGDIPKLAEARDLYLQAVRFRSECKNGISNVAVAVGASRELIKP